MNVQARHVGFSAIASAHFLSHPKMSAIACGRAEADAVGLTTTA